MWMSESLVHDDCPNGLAPLLPQGRHFSRNSSEQDSMFRLHFLALSAVGWNFAYRCLLHCKKHSSQGAWIFVSFSACRKFCDIPQQTQPSKHQFWESLPLQYVFFTAFEDKWIKRKSDRKVWKLLWRNESPAIRMFSRTSEIPSRIDTVTEISCFPAIAAKSRWIRCFTNKALASFVTFRTG